MSLYPEVNNLSVNTQAAYVSVNKTSHKILKMYVGVNGKSELFYDATGGNRIYLYNNGDECTSVTGGWNIIDEATAELSTCEVSKGANCLYVHLGAVSVDNVVYPGFCTENECLPTTSYRIGIEYSFSCNKTDDEDYVFIVSSVRNNTGSIMGSFTSPSSSVVVETNYVIPDEYNNAYQLQLEVSYSNYSDLVYYPPTTLQIYKVWYEPYEI